MKTFCKNIHWATREMQAMLMGPGFYDPEQYDDEPASLSQEDSQKMYKMLFVLFGSYACIHGLLTRPSLSRKTTKIFVDAWPGFIYSMVLTLNGSFLCQFISGQFSDLAYSLICGTLMRMANRCDSRTIQNLLLDEELPEIMSFLLLLDHNPSPAEKPLKVEPQVSATLTSCLDSMNAKDRTAFLDGILQHADLDWDSYTLHLHHLLKRFWDGDQRNYWFVSVVIEAIVKVPPRSDFWTLNMKKSTLPLIIKILTGSSKVIIRTDKKEDLGGQFKTVRLSILFCCYVLSSPSGSTWSVQLFRHGILRAIFNCIPAVASSPKDVQTALNDLVLHVIPSELVFGPVIDAAAQAWKETIANKGEPKFEGSFFRKEWSFLKNLIMERVIKKDIFIMKTGGKFSATCNRTGCNKREHEVRFIRCAGCRLAIYCSKECRKMDWNTIHRNGCAISYVPEDEHVRQRDLQCAMSILASETHRHRRGLKALARRKYPEIPFNKLTVVIDYTTKKLVFDVKTSILDDLKKDLGVISYEEDSEDSEDEHSEQRGVSRNSMSSVTDEAVDESQWPENAFRVLWAKMRKGTVFMSAFYNGAKGLDVPDDDDLRPAMPVLTGGLRIQGEDPDGNLLETTWDEFDEALYRIETFGGGDPSAGIPLCSFDHLISI
ncbi:hypothetical protein SCHPADRAFT_232358 [Schizopora paradoxa]|uniref:MYND-type domain-containing protein n=1 Tax=Schizopora paradoxa TaxID=27342 RepID=A0A0H2RW19_9AGAM|nr:hypothetical protein SCHPADRAFT_232358 [Schizopora paradoxa]